MVFLSRLRCMCGRWTPTSRLRMKKNGRTLCWAFLTRRMLKSLNDRIVYGFVLAVDVFFSILPRSWAFAMGEYVGLLFSIVMVRRRRLVVENLRHSFPEKTDDEIRRIAAGMWRNLGRTAIEFIRLADIHKGTFDRYFVVEGRENI